MNFDDMIRRLREDHGHLVRAILELQSIVNRNGHNAKAAKQERRGRKSMNPEERKQVSERMKKYWASRKQRKASGGKA